MEIRSIILNQADNVAVLAQPAAPGDVAVTPAGNFSIQEQISTGHKIAVRAIAKGEMIYKYGKVIGQASQDIAPGEWVHTHNVTDITEQLCNEYAAKYRAKEA